MANKWTHRLSVWTRPGTDEKRIYFNRTFSKKSGHRAPTVKLCIYGDHEDRPIITLGSMKPEEFGVYYDAVRDKPHQNIIELIRDLAGRMADDILEERLDTNLEQVLNAPFSAFVEAVEELED